MVQVKTGTIKSNFSPSVYGKGITGLEITRDNKGKPFNSYNTWERMLRRCYSYTQRENNITYEDCSVCDEWLYYSNFKKWFNENYYKVNNEKMELDKDILHKGNKVYSPKTCVFVPKKINLLFTKNNKNRGATPIGVSYIKYNNKYQARCSIFNIKLKKSKNVYLGTYNTPEEAFNAYKQFKEKYIKQVADEYKDKIPLKLYKAMYSYKVEITD